jgi:hypothetical protein
VESGEESATWELRGVARSNPTGLQHALGVAALISPYKHLIISSKVI